MQYRDLSVANMIKPSDVPALERLAEANAFDLSAVTTPSGNDTLGIRIYRNLREALLSGVLSSGDQLSIRPIAAAFGTSAMPVREAMTRLVGDGALAAAAQRAFIVPPVTEEGLRELTLLRTRLEPMAAEYAATRQTIESLHRLRSVYATIENPTSSSEYLAAHRIFHFTIYAGAELPHLFSMIESLWLRMSPIMTMALESVDLTEERDAHSKILAALERGDPTKAALAIEADLRNAMTRTAMRLVR